MLKYIIIEGGTMAHLCLDVDKAAKRGYVPIGGVALYNADQSQYPIFYQAMIKEDRNLFAEKMKAAKRKGWTLDEVIANAMGGVLEEANAEED